MRAHATRRFLLAAGLGAGLLAGLSACGGGGDVTAPAQGDMRLGNAQAPVTVIEYASVACGACIAWNQEVWPEFRRRYVDSNRVNYVFREMLTGDRASAAQGFILARCAGQDRYFGVIDAVMRSQQEIAQTQQPRPVLLRIAQSAGMTEAQFNSCLRDEAALTAMNDRAERAGRNDGIESTPTFVINGQRLVGAQSLEQLAAVIDPLLGANRPPALNATPPATSGAASTPASTPVASGSASGAASTSATAATAPTAAGPVTATTAASGAPAQ